MTKSGGLAQIGVHPFDPETGEVRGPCGTTTLRRQTSRVLAVLLAAPGRLVLKDHLMNSVRCDAHVTDDSLVQCILEIRKALGPEGGRRRVTMPRRGYRIDTTGGAPSPHISAPLRSTRTMSTPTCSLRMSTSSTVAPRRRCR